MEFKDVLKEIRLERNLTQKQLAEMTGFSLSTINKWENEKKSPNMFSIKILSEILNVSSDYLLGLQEY